MLKIFQKDKNKNSPENSPAMTNFDKAAREKRLQKRVFFLTAAIALLAMVLGIWGIERTLKSPFISEQPSNHNTNAALATTNTASLARLESLRDKDTDQDGVSDYDELYIYKTSPYLTDSDSDGISDQLEISQGTDPNCPKGSDCSRSTTNSSANTNSSTVTNSAVNVNGTSVDVSNLSASDLRTVLRNAGASEEQLSQIDDATILQNYQAILKEEQSASSNANTSVKTNANTVSLNNANTQAANTNSLDYSNITYDDLANFTPAQIRQLLIQNGVAQDMLDQIDDETLKQIYLQSLNQNLQEATNTNS